MTVGAGRHVAAGLAVAAMLLGVVLYEFFVWFPTPDWIAMMAGMASVPAAVLFAFVAWALPSVRTPFRRMAILLVPITVGIGWAAFSAWSAQMTTLASALSALLWTAPPVFALAAAPLSASSVRLTWSTGHHGMFAVLNRDGAGYRGVAAGFTDVNPSPVPRAKVSATAVDCSRVAPDSARGARLGG